MSNLTNEELAVVIEGLKVAAQNREDVGVPEAAAKLEELAGKLEAVLKYNENGRHRPMLRDARKLLGL